MSKPSENWPANRHILPSDNFAHLLHKKMQIEVAHLVKMGLVTADEAHALAAQVARLLL